ncbi:MAG TPA: EamA family transporter, partial [Capsulimonadaceae bacterium]|nr:EamA family transporter [Capsulimonadaceae bacterium]
MASEVQPIPAASVRLRAQIIVALLTVYIVWGSTYLAIRIGLECLPPFFLGGCRFFVAGLILFMFLLLRGAKPPTLPEWGGSTIVGGL